MFAAYFEDKEKGGLFHAMSEDWAECIDTDKHAEEQFADARTADMIYLTEIDGDFLNGLEVQGFETAF